MTDTLDKIRERKGFYIRYYRLAVKALYISMIIIFLLLIGIMVVRSTYKESLVYATGSNGMLELLTTRDKL
ncbi:MAG: hypothetical protein ACNA7Y_03070 [Gammaproteobacteria bacterium]